MILFSGFVVFGAGALILAKLKRRWLLKALNNELLLDVAVSGITLALHWGTFSGVMAATVAGVLNSIATSAARRLIGHIDGNTYHPGIFFFDPNAKGGAL